jgi:hypothetical protein
MLSQPLIILQPCTGTHVLHMLLANHNCENRVAPWMLLGSRYARFCFAPVCEKYEGWSGSSRGPSVELRAFLEAEQPCPCLCHCSGDSDALCVTLRLMDVLVAPDQVSRLRAQHVPSVRVAKY